MNNILNNFVDKCYYINLEHRIDKKEALTQHLTDLGINNSFQRIDGVKPEDLGYVRKKDKFEIIEYSIAAAKAHQNVIKDAKDNDYECILILEDDAMFHIDETSNGLDIAIKAIEQVKFIED
jgi:GR25 family glycosyltransferase involved in LPS biosynthesis